MARTGISLQVNLTSSPLWRLSFLAHFQQPRSLFDGLDQSLHSFFMLSYGFEQFELRPGAVEIMFVAAHFVIDVALQIVRQESDALLECHQFAGECKVLFFGFR